MNFYSKRYDYVDIEDYPLDPFGVPDKCDYIGFRPLSVRIKEMKSKGALNELISALENNDIPLSDFFRHFSDTEAHTKPISVLNIKGLDKVELNDALLARANIYKEYEAKFKNSLLNFRGNSSDSVGDIDMSEPPQTASE